MSIIKTYFLFICFTELYYFITHFNFHEGNSLIFVSSHPFLKDPLPPPLFLYHPFLQKKCTQPTPFLPYCNFWEALSPS